MLCYQTKAALGQSSWEYQKLVQDAEFEREQFVVQDMEVTRVIQVQINFSQATATVEFFLLVVVAAYVVPVSFGLNSSGTVVVVGFDAGIAELVDLARLVVAAAGIDTVWAVVGFQIENGIVVAVAAGFYIDVGRVDA